MGDSCSIPLAVRIATTHSPVASGQARDRYRCRPWRLAGRLALAALLIWAGASKFMEPMAFVRAGRELLDLLAITGWRAQLALDVWPRLEIGLGIALLLGLWPRVMAWACLVLLLAATGVLLNAAVQGLSAVQCRCFGDTLLDFRSPWLGAVRNAVLALVAVGLIRAYAPMRGTG